MWKKHRSIDMCHSTERLDQKQRLGARCHSNRTGIKVSHLEHCHEKMIHTLNGVRLSSETCTSAAVDSAVMILNMITADLENANILNLARRQESLNKRGRSSYLSPQYNFLGFSTTSY